MLTRISPGISLVILALAIGWCAAPASALIEVKSPVSVRYQRAKAVVVGKVTAVDPVRGLIEADSSATLKGEVAIPHFRVLADRMRDLVKAVQVGEAIVIMTGQTSVSIHVGGVWLQAAGTAAGAAPGQAPLWRVAQVDPTGHRDFPGTTADLARVLDALKAGKPALLDKFDGKLFSDGSKEIARLDVSDPTFLLALDVKGDGKHALAVGTSKGVKLFIMAGEQYTDATAQWGLSGARGRAAASGHAGGTDRVDLLIGSALYLFDGAKFNPAAPMLDVPAGADVLAESLADFTGDGKPDAALLLADGTLLGYENPGAAGKPWPRKIDRKLLAAGLAPQAAAFGDWAGDGTLSVIVVLENAITRYAVALDGPPADFTRLSGDPLNQVKPFAGGIKEGCLVEMDLNGDRRPDLLIMAHEGSAALLNRGFGAFLVDPDPFANANGDKKLPFPLGVGAARKGAGADELLVLGRDGRLFLLANPAAETKKP